MPRLDGEVFRLGTAIVFYSIARSERRIAMINCSGARALVPKDAALYRLTRHFASACPEKSALSVAIPMARHHDFRHST
jgi:hypothetical protein